jgi:transcriptional regulator with XRE-family HTH domain
MAADQMPQFKGVVSTPADVGRRIQDLRKKKGLSQGELAEKLTVSQSLVSQWERGAGTPSGEQIQQLESMLGRMPGTGAGSAAVVVDDLSGDKIKERRINNGLSQKELAEKMGVSQPLVSQWEVGRQKPSRDQIARLQSILGGIADVEGSAPSETESAIGAWLSKARLNKNFTVNELANKSGVSPAAIYNIEKGRAENPHPKTIKALEAALGDKLESEKEVTEASEIKGVGDFVDFDPYDVKNLPETAGVYVFYDISQRPIYVGQGISIARRIRDHHEKFWFKRPIVENGAYVEIGEKRLREQVETILIRFLKQNAVINRNKVDRD